MYIVKRNTKVLDENKTLLENENNASEITYQYVIYINLIYHNPIIFLRIYINILT